MARSLLNHRALLFMALMAGLMTLIITFVLAAVRTQLGAGFLGVWLLSWAIAFPTAFLAGLVVIPAVQRVVDALAPGSVSSSPPGLNVGGGTSTGTPSPASPLTVRDRGPNATDKRTSGPRGSQ
jgi:hypothetical protein